MLFCYIFLVVSMMSFLRDFHVSSCDYHCADKPVFTPPRLVVKFGDSTSASCSLCEPACINDIYNLESPVGLIMKNGSTIKWTVDRLTEWVSSPTCYYSNDTGHQCCTDLNVTLYQPPHNVSFSFVDHTGPMFEGQQYTLQCTVEDVAPVENLTVTFYRGQTELGQLQSNENNIKPVTEIFSLNITLSKEDDGVQYWCEAKLELGPHGPQPPPVVTSQTINATVFYKPQRERSSHPDPISVTKGDPLQLNCSAVGNPSPSYTWTLPSKSLSTSNSSVLTINSATFVDEGKYTCSVSNDIETVTVEFNVDVLEPNVSINFFNHTGPMSEGQQYTLQCTVEDVAPVENLNVTFYRGQTAMGQLQSYKNNTRSVTEIFSFNITPSKEDDGVQYWCEAKPELGPHGPHGPQPPLVVTSQTITANVYYKPQRERSSHPDPISVMKGDPLQLNCSAVGNPSPSYTWTLPSESPSTSNISVLTINSATFADEGKYSCSVSNDMGTVTMEFNVDVQGNYMIIIISAIVAACVLSVSLVLIGYFNWYNRNRKGHYNMNIKDVFRLHPRHSAVPISE